MGRFLSLDPVGFDEANLQSFNKYAYANNNPYRFVDPDGANAVTAFGGLLTESYNFVTGNGFNGAAILGALKDGYNGEGKGFASSAAEDVLSFGGGALGAASKLHQLAKAGKAAKNIPVSRARYGEAADHISDAQRAGHPDVLTIARPGAPANRNASIGGLPRVPGKQLDEYPPAMFKEGGAGASVRPINPRDNMGAGACIGNACRALPDGARVKIKVVD
ncbi:hypothetical protein G3446_16615 [Thiorhodococcus minor]|uniref:Deoxyribonuclease NucA/NucB domain-containing protein n=1 Tax=Thiorhodococcus minor TaxID=57489 RepID=A0A6M0K169_9GAMM|nr:hypothetical protein [Thiorhodococcus minor]